jgi:hypothetical protein
MAKGILRLMRSRMIRLRVGIGGWKIRLDWDVIASKIGL